MKRLIFVTIIFIVTTFLPVLRQTGPCLAADTHQHGGMGTHSMGGTGPILDFILTSQDNRPVSLRDFKGKVVLINFIYASCKETCPILIKKFLEVQDAMKTRLGKDIILLSITIDPERDTPPILKEYARKMGAGTKGWFFLTGKPQEVDRVLKDYGVYYEKGQDGRIGHINLIILIDRKGNRQNFGGFSYPKEMLLSAINEALR
ncbi:MAG: SCO family protein [Deltaproteobacteria bacterium]|nr:SCO family protein [Deltaproteobacteria bacterium]